MHKIHELSPAEIELVAGGMYVPHPIQPIPLPIIIPIDPGYPLPYS